MTSPPLLELRDVSVTFDVGGGLLSRGKALRAVSGVSFSLEPGSCLGVVGESGCGKSTLGRAILRFVPLAGGGRGMDGAGRPVAGYGFAISQCVLWRSGATHRDRAGDDCRAPPADLR